MKARIEYAWGRDAMKVWLYQPGGPTSIQVVGFEKSGEAVLRNVKEGEDAGAPSMILPRAAIEALVREASGVLPPSDATVDALKDARVVRDRLLTLIERNGTAAS